MGEGPPPRRVRVLVIGAGFGGLGLAHTLRRIGLTDFLVLDRGDTVGGTWRDNTYPGCGCDVASHLYSFSFAPNPNWSRSYSGQPEILRYLERVAREHDLLRHVRLRTEVQSATWDDAAARWRVRTSRGDLVADLLVAATGPLSRPRIPDLPGLSTFPGPVLHSAAWRHDVDLRGKRVAVVGTGASAVQFVPRIQPDVARLTVFQRTPPWILPRGDRAITTVERRFFRRLPWTQKLVRAGHYTAREATVAGFVVQPAILRAGELASRALLRRQVPDPARRRLLTPTTGWAASGCCRPTTGTRP